MNRLSDQQRQSLRDFPQAKNAEKFALFTTLCAAGSAGWAQDVATETSESEEVSSLPTINVESTHPAAPAPRPVPRPVPAPEPEPVIVPEPEPEPLVIDDSTYRPQNLSVSKYTQPLLDVPQTVQVITEDLIEDQGATTLREALRNVSGISLQAGEGGQPAGDNLSIRGFSARTDFFIDGIRDFGAYTRDPFNLEQIEVAKGPASANAGRGSTGGSINLVSKKARLNDFIHSDLSIGSDDLHRATLDINQALPGIDGAAVRLNVMGHEAGVPGRDFVENSRWGVAGTLGFGLGETTYVPGGGKSGKQGSWITTPSDTRLNVSFFHLEEDNVPDYGIPWVPDNAVDPRLTPYINQAPPISYDKFYGSLTRDFEDTETTIGTVEFEHDINDSVTFRNRTRIGQTERLSLTTAPRFVTGSDPALIRRSDWKDRDEKNTIFANQSDFLMSFNTGAVHHDALLGFEYIKEDNERFRRATSNPGIDTDFFNPNPNDPIYGTFKRTGAATYADSTSTSVYLFDTAEITDWLELSGGLRHERFELDYMSVDTAGAASFLSRVDDMTSGRASVVVKPQENGSVYFGYGTSFNPSGEGLALSDGGRGGSTYQTDPEKSETLELGTKWDLFDNRLSLTGALFETNKTNARTVDPADPDRVAVLEGVQRVHGFEFGLAGEITPWWSVYASYTHLDSEVLSSLDPTQIGNELPNTPQNSFSLWTQVDLPNGLFVGGGPVFVDSRYNSVTNLREAPSYCIWDAAVGYEVNENLTLRVNLRNLEDKDYIGRVGGGHFIPGEGRSVMFTASLEF